MCVSSLYSWNLIGDPYGTDRTCTVDTNGGDPIYKDCGITDNRTVDPNCSWVADPDCGSFLENGPPGQRGVWARSTLDLSEFAGEKARLRWVFQAGGGWGFGETRSFLEPQYGGLSFTYDQDDGWWIDDIRITDVRTGPAFTSPDPTTGTSTCPAPGDTLNCGIVTPWIAGSVPDAATGGLTLFAQFAVAGAPVRLDARPSAAGDDPNTPEVEGGCTGGVLEYAWSALDGAGGAVTQEVAPFSPGGVATVTPLADTVYRLDVRCSSDTGCTASEEVEVLVYSGDGTDLDSEVLADGLWINHDPVVDEATLSWRARPQPAGVAGYDLFRATIAGGTGLFPGGAFLGSPFDPDGAGPQTSSCNVPNGAPGERVEVVDVMPPGAGTAHVYMVAHSSNNGAAIAPLGRRPECSDRAGELVTASVPCP
jgi:hypothetical protein